MQNYPFYPTFVEGELKDDFLVVAAVVPLTKSPFRYRCSHQLGVQHSLISRLVWRIFMAVRMPLDQILT